MRLPWVVQSLATLFLSFVGAIEAHACSVDDTYRIPTNFELVEKADLIVLARVTSGPRDLDDGDPFEPRILLTPERFLKGTPGPDPLYVLGTIGWNGEPVPLMPTPLNQSHFSAGLGACVRIFYPEDALVLAFFRRTPDGLYQMGEPWARAVEDVEGPNGVWVRATEVYLDIQEQADGFSRQQAIEQRRDALHALTGDMAAQAIADDLDRHLRVLDGETDKTASGRRWMLLDTPREAGAIAGRQNSGQFSLLFCKQGDRNIRVEAVGAREAQDIVLTLGDRLFDVRGEHIGEREGKPAIVGEVAASGELLALMREVSSEAGLLADGATFMTAPPSDVLQKLSLRCAALLAD